MTGLIADVGGTNARLALVDEAGRIGPATILSCADHPNLEPLLRAYLAGRETPGRAAIAVACPVTGDRVAVTNRNWVFSIEEMRRSLGLEELRVVNDFAAVALSLPHLGPGDLRPIGGGARAEGAPMVALGPGTGLGVSLLVPTPGGGRLAVPTEGGHATLPVATDREAAMVSVLRREFGHVSVERLLSGPGLANLRHALGVLEGREGEARLDPAAVTARGLDRSCPLCAEALDMFCALLGTVAGNLALGTGARGGVYLAGGIVPRLGEAFFRSAFRERFEAKGRFRDYLREVPTALILQDQPAFLGLAGLLRTG